MLFKMLCGSKNVLFYDNITNRIFDKDMKKIEIKSATGRLFSKEEVDIIDKDNPGKKGRVNILKIQLGMGCNFSCSYCNQNSQKILIKSPSPKEFIEKLDSWLKEAPKIIEFWGGEPLLYWDILKPLAEALREKFTNTFFLMITNGSLLTPEINTWLDEIGFGVGISHDGPGQHLRGTELFDEPYRTNVIDLVEKLLPENRISFNCMLTPTNHDREAIQKYFIKEIGKRNIRIGEGTCLEVHDKYSHDVSVCDEQKVYEIRNKAFSDIRNITAMNFSVVSNRMQEWIDALACERNAYTLHVKCGSDSNDTLTVDLNGDALICQNKTSSTGRIGSVYDYDNIKLTNNIHWSSREECGRCPVLQTCKGSCPIISDEFKESNCFNSFNDHIPFFAAAIEATTGEVPFFIFSADGVETDKIRSNIFGL